MTMRILCAVGVFGILAGCAPHEPTPVPPPKIAESSPAPASSGPASVPAGDPVMDAAIAHARQTLDQFIKHLQHPAAGESDFNVKAPFKTDSGNIDHLRLRELVYMDGGFSGKLASEAMDITRFTLRDVLTVKSAERSDWVYAAKSDRQSG